MFDTALDAVAVVLCCPLFEHTVVPLLVPSLPSSAASLTLRMTICVLCLICVLLFASKANHSQLVVVAFLLQLFCLFVVVVHLPPLFNHLQALWSFCTLHFALFSFLTCSISIDHHSGGQSPSTRLLAKQQKKKVVLCKLYNRKTCVCCTTQCNAVNEVCKMCFWANATGKVTRLLAH